MELIVFTGIPASGKTTFYAQRFLATHVRVSLDMLKTRQRESASIADSPGSFVDPRWIRFVHLQREKGREDIYTSI